MQVKNELLVRELQKTGFTDKEAVVYVTVLELGSAYPSRIAEYSGIKRATAYNILTTLAIRGLVNEIEKRGKLFYQISKPQKLLAYSRTKIQLAEESLSRAEKLLPDLEGIFSLIADRPKVQYLEGPDAVLTIGNDLITDAKNYELLSFSNANKLYDFLSESQLRNFMKEKIRLRITTRIIAPDTPENRAYGAETFKDKKEELQKKRYAPPELFPHEAEITIYAKNKVSIVKLGGPTIIGVIIEDAVIHDMMKMIFELSWSNPMLKE